MQAGKLSRTPLRKETNMKATIEFNLPAEHDAYLDAINGTRWKEVMRAFEWTLNVWRDTEENSDRRHAHDIVLRQLRDERKYAGLTYATVKSLKQDHARMDKFWWKRLNEYLKAQGIPEMMAEMRKENQAPTTPKRKNPKITKADKKHGVQSNSHPTEPE